MTKRPRPELEALIGEAALVRLAEAFGGTRLYVPSQMGPDHEIVIAIGEKAAALLAERCSPDVIRVPLAREQRARHYRAAGKSNGQIASALGMTEPGVYRLLKRTSGSSTVPSAKSTDDDRQLPLL